LSEADVSVDGALGEVVVGGERGLEAGTPDVYSEEVQGTTVPAPRLG